MAVEWEQAPREVTDLAQKLIDAYHPHLADARIGFVFRAKAMRFVGLEVWAQAGRISPKLQAFLPLDFLIWVAQDIWEDLEPERREALLDHELCHCQVTEAGNFTMRGHDVQEFIAIIQRRGMWTHNLEALDKAMAQRSDSPASDGTVKKGKLIAIPPAAMKKLGKKGVG